MQEEAAHKKVQAQPNPVQFGPLGWQKRALVQLLWADSNSRPVSLYDNSIAPHGSTGLLEKISFVWSFTEINFLISGTSCAYQGQQIADDARSGQSTSHSRQSDVPRKNQFQDFPSKWWRGKSTKTDNWLLLKFSDRKCSAPSTGFPRGS
jgi:hypothetical protein